MDTVLLFALPLVGGLIFCSTWNFTRWRVAREDGHRLYFRSVFFGALIFVFVLFVRAEFEGHFAWIVKEEAPIKEAIKPMVKEKASENAVADLSISCLVAMVLGWPLARLLNLMFWKDYWLRRAIKEDEFEAFLLDAADREFPVLATMDDGKVYVGWVVEGFNPSEDRKSILLLPLISGYRTKDTHKVTFTTFYTDLYGEGSVAGVADQTKPLPAPLAHLRAEDFITLLPVDKIASWRLFDADAYQAFQRRKPAASEQTFVAAAKAAILAWLTPRK